MLSSALLVTNQILRQLKNLLNGRAVDGMTH